MSGGPVEIEGPLELVDGRFLLRIPLDVGGEQLISVTRGISRIVGEVLEIEIPENLVRNLKLTEGQRLWVTVEDGQFQFGWEPEQ